MICPTYNYSYKDDEWMEVTTVTTITKVDDDDAAGDDDAAKAAVTDTIADLVNAVAESETAAVADFAGAGYYFRRCRSPSAVQAAFQRWPDLM